MDTNNKKKVLRRFRGVVVSDAMDKTIVVQVSRQKRHSKYHKYFTVYKKYKVHDPENKFKVGNKVEFIECRPLSREKRWKVVYT